MTKKMKIFIGGAILVPVVLLFLLIGIVRINVSPDEASLTLDNKQRELPFNSYLLYGYHEIKIEKAGYNTINEKIFVKPGVNNFSFNLVEKRVELITRLPIYTDNYNLDYGLQGSFLVTIKSEPVEKVKSEVIKLLEENGIKSEEENIVWDTVAGIGEKTGP